MTATSRPESLPRWGFQEHLVQRSNAAFWAFVTLVVLGTLNFIGEQLAFTSVDPVALALSWLLMLAYIAPVVLVLLRLDLYEREPVSLMVGAFAWGALVAPSFAGIVNVQVAAILHGSLGGGVFFPWQAALTAPVVEETYKVLGVVALYLIAAREFDDLMDGFVYGALVGLGFAVTEDVFYFMTHFGGSVDGVVSGFVVRVLAAGLYSHVLWSGLAGIGVAYFAVHRVDRSFANRLAVAVGLVALAMFAHFVWNSPLEFGDGLGGLLVYGTIKGAPFLLLLALAVRLAQRRERRWLRGALGSELAAEVVTPADVEALIDGRLAKQERQQAQGSGGAAGLRALRDLRREQVNLAMVRTRVDRDDHPDLIRQRATVVDLRAQLDAVLTRSPGTVGVAMQRSARSGSDRWVEDGRVPEGGMTAWPVPDGTAAGAVALAAGLPLRRLSRLGDWCQVEAADGWRGWVDGRRLVDAARDTTLPASTP